MVALTLLYLAICYSLYALIMEESTRFVKDVRFWLALLSFVVLVFLTLESYPI